MSTFFWSIIDFIFSTSFVRLFLIPVPFYCLGLFYRIFSSRSD